MITIPTQRDCAFAAYLHAPAEQNYLNLTEASLIDCINAKIQIKSRTNAKTKKQYFSLLKALREIQEEYQVAIYPDKISELFYSFFIHCLETKGRKPSSIKTMVSQIKSVVEWSSHYGARISPTYNIVELPKVTVKNISLTPDDVSRIYHLDIDAIPRRSQHLRTLKQVRDMFCLMCNTGMRYSDARRLTREHFEDRTIHILQQKTKIYAHINIHDMSIHEKMTLEILDRYDYKAPYPCDGTLFDRLLHELMQYARFDDNVRLEYVVNGNVKTETKKKYQLITSHTARRTFVVNNALRGKSILEIMRATGHKSFDTFQKYLCYS